MSFIYLFQIPSIPVTNYLFILHRKRSNHEGFISDVYDSEVYVRFKNMVPADHRVIFIQVCWDGAEVFNNRTDTSMWPLVYSIMSLPPSLRDKPHIGMHLASFDDEAALKKFADELDHLWTEGMLLICYLCNAIIVNCFVTVPNCA